MKTRIFLLIFSVLIFVGSDLSAFKQEIKPHYVIVRSFYRERISPPEVETHFYDPQSSESGYEPYLPKFELSDYGLPEDFPENKNPGWLSRTLPGLSEFLFKEEGVLENAILMYRREDLDKAEEKLEGILSAEKETGDFARLWLGWIKFKKGKWDESLEIIQGLLRSENRDALKEAYYLSSLILIKQSRFKRHLSLMKDLEGELRENDWGFRLNYCLLISLIRTKDWSAAEELLNKIQKSEFHHAKLYYKIKEAAGALRYAQGNYAESLKNYSRSANLDVSFKRRENLKRNIAWLHYLNGSFDKALKTVERMGETNGEMLYLKLLCLTKFKDWAAARNVLEEIAPKSDFYFYSAVKLRLCLIGSDKTDPILKKAVSTVGRHFTDEKFYVRLLEGFDYFRQKQWSKAEKEYLKAFSLDVDPRKKRIARYNMGLTRLKQKKFSEAELDFLWLADQPPILENALVHYHLLYAWYQLEKTAKFLELEKRTEANFSEKSIFEEVKLMKAGCLLKARNPWPAIEEFVEIWKRTRNPLAFEFAIKGYYKARSFKTVVRLIRRNPDIKSRTLLIYEVKSLLALKKFRKALRKIGTKDLDDERLLELRLEVLQANKLHDKIVELVSSLLKRELSDEQRRLYYLYLGDAYFNLKRYSESKNQFHKALTLTHDKWQKSMILHNIALSAYYQGDYASFLKETSIIIKKPEVSGEIKYNLTQLLVKYYRANNQPEMADSILEKYVRSGGYQRSKANIKRMHLLYKEKRFERCFELAAKKLKRESAYSRRDRIAMAGYCGADAGKSEEAASLIEAELENKAKYRREELIFILVQSRYNVGRFEEALELGLNLKEKLKKKLKEDKALGKIAMRLKLPLSAAYIKLNRLEEAKKELGDMERYRLVDQYHEALFLTAEIKKYENKIEDALRAVFRAYYLPEIDAKTRRKALLRLAELHQKLKMTPEARNYLNKIDEELIMTDVYLKSDYLKLKNELE